MIDWPTLAEIQQSIQNPSFCFRDPDLKGSSIEEMNGLPRPRSGAFAVVFKAFYANGGSTAVRVFSSPPGDKEERYRAIFDYLNQQNMKFIVPFKYSENGFRSINGKWYPLITMDWVEGETLFDWLHHKATSDNGKSISDISEKWKNTVQQLSKAKIAHGDLQHANVMITPSNEIKLVDYDGMCVPKLVGLKNEEIGVEPYQHPHRDGNTKLTLDLDNFSSAFIYVGLRALSAEPRLWKEFVVDVEYDKMLFQKEDFLNPRSSSLIGRLKKSPDGDVQRMTSRLCELYHASMSEVPPLDDFLFSFDQVSVLLGKSDFDGAVELISRNNKKVSDAPPDLQPLIKNAQQRVNKRLELDAAVAAADEAGMAACVGSPLLTDYPKAAAAYAMAEDAPAVAKVIQNLEAAKSSKNWREFVRVWEKDIAILKKPNGSLRKSAKPFSSVAASWRDRHTVADQLLECLQPADPDGRRVSQLWKKVEQLGGHPECDAIRQKIELVIQRADAWQVIQGVVQMVSLAADKTISSSWDEQLFQGWSTAEAVRSRFEDANKRLHAYENFVINSKGPVSSSGEEKILAIGASLPTGYSKDHETRVALATKRLASHKLLGEAVHKDSDSGIAAAFRQLEALKATSLIQSRFQKRVSIAVQRESILKELQKIPKGYSVFQSPKWDKKILKIWDESLLRECRDATEWRSLYEQAYERKSLLEALSEAIAKNDSVSVCHIVESPVFQDYPFDEKTRKRIEQAQDDNRCLQGMIESLGDGDRHLFVQSFNARLIRMHAEDLPHWDQLIEWIATEVLPPDKMGLKPPRANRPLNLLKKTSGKSSCTIRWSWPDSRFTDECYVAICRTRPKAGHPPQEANAFLHFSFSRSMYESAGGFCRQITESSWQGAYVVVWGKLDLGSEVFWSEPLILGKL